MNDNKGQLTEEEMREGTYGDFLIVLKKRDGYTGSDLILADVKRNREASSYIQEEEARDINIVLKRLCMQLHKLNGNL